MKNIFNSLTVCFFVLVTVLISFSSCSDDDAILPAPPPITGDYICTCTLSDVSGILDPIVASVNYIDVEILDALESCEATEAAGQTGLVEGFTYSCELTNY